MIRTIKMDMPTSIRAYTIEDKDGDHTVVLNSRLTHEQQLLSYAHELVHIKNEDFGCDDIDAVEKEVHTKITMFV